MINPGTCSTCHKAHYIDWSQSMHARAADDPVFLALNKRGQRETDGGLGNFCVQCHAPMAVRQEPSHNVGQELANGRVLEAGLKGVTCFFCHSVDSVDAGAPYNANVTLANDLVMRGEISDPVQNEIHASARSPLLDNTEIASAAMCGTCHDIKSPLGAHIERTFCEWSHSPFNANHEGGGLTCASGGTCHMIQSQKVQPIALGSANPRLRYYHAHDFPAVDVPLEPLADAGVATGDGGGGSDSSNATDAGDSADAGDAADALTTTTPAGTGYAQDAATTASVQFSLNNALRGALCVSENGGIRVVLDPFNVGHQWPSGAAQDRRAWAEVIAYTGGKVVYQSGFVPDGTPVGQQTTDTDPKDLWILRDEMFGPDGGPVDMFWQAAQAYGSELPVTGSFDPAQPAYYASHITRSFPRDGAPIQRGLERVTLRIRLQPIGLDVLNDLVTSHDLDPSIAAAMPTFDVPIVPTPGASKPALLVWTPAAADPMTKFNAGDGSDATCVGFPSFSGGGAFPAQTHETCTP
jgi:hypothetical protein